MLIIRLDHEAETYAILKPEAALDELVFNEYTHINKISTFIEDFNRRIQSLKDSGYIDISDLFEG